MAVSSFEEKTDGYIKENGMLEKGCSVTLGVSGGADSVCLFFMFLRLRRIYELRLNVIHVMHGIRKEEAVRDMEFTKSLCEKHGVDFKCVKEDVPQLAAKMGLSIEEAGRYVRYEAFDKAGSDRIAVAHNRNDLAETVLFNLIRGSGIRGLGGISPVNGRIIRPLLCVTRQEIEEYLKGLGQDWCDDSTNSDNDYSRNRIRNVLLREAEKINPTAVGHIAKSAAELSAAELCLSGITQKAFAEFARQEEDRIYIRTDAKDKLEPYIFGRVIYEALCRASGKKKDIAAVHVEDVRELFYKQSGRCIDLIYGLQGKRCFDEVMIGRKSEPGAETKEDFEISLNRLLNEGEMTLPDGRKLFAEVSESPREEFTKVSHTDSLDYDKIDIGSVIRVRRPGDRISIKGGHKKLKDFLIEKKIPEDKRDDILLLAHENDVYWVEKLRTSAECEVRGNTKRIIRISVKEA